MNSTPPFGVNGRVPIQPMTWMQRCARNLVTAMNTALEDLEAKAPIIVSAPLPACRGCL
jgi:hypothetical protein